MTTWLDGKLTTTLHEAPALLNVQCNTVLRWIKSGEMLDTRFGRNTTQLTFDQVVSFIEKSKTVPIISQLRNLEIFGYNKVVAGKP